MLSTVQPIQRTIFLTGTFMGITSVMLGALGTHAIKPLITAEQLSTFETGIRYQQLHTILLFICGFLLFFFKSTLRLPFAFYTFTAGIILFSGSCYIIAMRDYWQLSLPKIFFLTTPLGGLLFIIGWILIAATVIKKGS